MRSGQYDVLEHHSSNTRMSPTPTSFVVEQLPKHNRRKAFRLVSSVSIVSAASSTGSLNCFLGRYGLSKTLDQIEENFRRQGTTLPNYLRRFGGSTERSLGRFRSSLSEAATGCQMRLSQTNGLHPLLQPTRSLFHLAQDIRTFSTNRESAREDEKDNGGEEEEARQYDNLDCGLPIGVSDVTFAPDSWSPAGRMDRYPHFPSHTLPITDQRNLLGKPDHPKCWEENPVSPPLPLAFGVPPSPEAPPRCWQPERPATALDKEKPLLGDPEPSKVLQLPRASSEFGNRNIDQDLVKHLPRFSSSEHLNPGSVAVTERKRRGRLTSEKISHSQAFTELKGLHDRLEEIDESTLRDVTKLADIAQKIISGEEKTLATLSSIEKETKESQQCIKSVLNALQTLTQTSSGLILEVSKVSEYQLDLTRTVLCTSKDMDEMYSHRETGYEGILKTEVDAMAHQLNGACQQLLRMSSTAFDLIQTALDERMERMRAGNSEVDKLIDIPPRSSLSSLLPRSEGSLLWDEHMERRNEILIATTRTTEGLGNGQSNSIRSTRKTKEAVSQMSKDWRAARFV